MYSNRFSALISVASCVILMGALACAAVQANGPTTQSQLRGRVLDQQRAAIFGVKITAVRNGANDSVSTVTNASGEFSLLLEPGEYTLRCSAEGFAEATLIVRSKPSVFEPLEIVLQLEGYTATVNVTDTLGFETFSASATRTLTALRDVPQSVAVISREAIKDQGMQSIADVVRYVPGITAIQGENNRDQVVIRGNSSSADFFLDGVRDDVQYYRDLYNLDRVEALKGPNAMIFGRGGGGVINRVTKEAFFGSLGELTFQGGAYGNKRALGDFNRALNERVALRLNG